MLADFELSLESRHGCSLSLTEWKFTTFYSLNLSHTFAHTFSLDIFTRCRRLFLLSSLEFAYTAADEKGGKVDEHDDDDDVECMSEILCKSFFISIMCISCVHELILEIFVLPPLHPLSARRHERDEIWEMLGKILLKLKLFWKLDSKADEQGGGKTQGN